jgi:all-trans-retinol 13,14-reductase
MWDAIVIGSGISGLAAGAALSRAGKRVLLLEQHMTPGGQTQTYRRGDWTFATGVHYLAGVGPSSRAGGRFGRVIGQFGRLLDWLSDGQIQFAPLANPYDIVRLPGFEFGIEHPEAAYRSALLERFPHDAADIDRWFDACHAAREQAYALLALHSAPLWATFALHMLRGADLNRWARHTLADELARISNDKLRAVLGTRWPDHGAPPSRAPFIEHAIVTGAYNEGAYYPVGGPARFAEVLAPLVSAAGGELRLGADVRRIVVERGRAAGVVYSAGGEDREERARHVIGAMGAANIVRALDPAVAHEWQQQVQAMQPGLSFLLLSIGFDGDIAAAGACSANVWIHESTEIERIWTYPGDGDAPGLFVSFQSLKDPAYRGLPTAEVLAMVDSGSFAQWLGDAQAPRQASYLALKEKCAARMLAQFGRHFPSLAGMVRFHELATPVTQQHYARTPAGSIYGTELSAERMTGPVLRVRRPVPGLALAGQDVFGPGLPGSFASGLYAAAAVEPTLWPRLLQA